MPSLKNLARIKDTITGKYLKACGFARYSWSRSGYFYDKYQRRNNSWSEEGTLYKRAHIQSALDNAALALAWKLAEVPPELDAKPAYEDREAWATLLEARKAYAEALDKTATIPDTWVVEEFVLSGMRGQDVPAKEWTL